LAASKVTGQQNIGDILAFCKPVKNYRGFNVLMAFGINVIMKLIKNMKKYAFAQFKEIIP